MNLGHDVRGRKPPYFPLLQDAPNKQKVSIESKFLDNKITDHLFDKLQKTMTGKCTLEYGYIMKINKLIMVGDNSITSANSLVVFDIIYEAEVLKPVVGQNLSGAVCMVFKHGIFVDIYNKMKVLIPVSSMKSYVFDNSRFVHDNDTEISVGVDVTITIVMIKYEKKEFSCIGKLKQIDINNNSESESESESDSYSD